METKNGFFSIDNVEECLKMAEKADVVAIGPGLGNNDNTRKFVNEFLKRLEKPVVVDADGLNVLDVSILSGRSQPTVITPHPGEMARLLSRTIEEVKYNYSFAEEFAKRHRCVLVLKSATTIVTDGENTFFNIMGNTGLSKGGSGDVLTGMISGFMAQKLASLEASALAVYLHGLAAEIFDGDERGFTASELLKLIPKAIRGLEE